MTIEIAITLITLAMLVAALVSNRVGPDTAMIGALTVLMVAGVIAPARAISGFADPSVLTIAALFVVATGLTETGAMTAVAQRILGRPKTLAGAQVRLMVPVAAMSAFMNNTPIVAMYLPIVHEWCRRLRISPSRMYMPLSFAAILGGSCTLIGTSTNLAVMQLYLAHVEAHASELASRFGVSAPSTAKQFWMIAVVGVPAALVGIPFVVLASRWLLPARVAADEDVEGAREYTIEMTVPAKSPIVGRTIEQADLRNLPGIYLVEIEREGVSMPAVGPGQVLEEGDRLIFAGVIGSVVDLLKSRGLTPATDQVNKIEVDRRDRTVVEAVVSSGSPLVRKTVRGSQFRTRYNAAIIAVHRGGQRIKERIGDIRLLPGDTLLLLTHRGFSSAYRNSPDFFLVSDVEGAVDVRHERAWVALGIMGLLVALMTLPTGRLFMAINGAVGTSLPEGGMPPVVVAFLAAALMVYTRCCTGTTARSAINWQVLLTIAAAIGVGKAMTDTGAAALLAHTAFAPVERLGPHAMVFAVFMITSVFSQLITNKGAAVLMFPILMAIAEESGTSPEPLVLTLMAAAACSFMTPVGFVTNLMVLGPGGYRFTDYLRLGLPLTVLVALICAVVAPLVLPGHPLP